MNAPTVAPVVPAKAGIQGGAQRRAVSGGTESLDSRLRGNDDGGVSERRQERMDV